MSQRPIIGTTQSFDDQHNMVVGSLSHFTITVNNTTDRRFKHRSRRGDVTLGSAELVAGVEYTVKTVVDADKRKNWSVIGGKDGTQTYTVGSDTRYHEIEMDEKFIARGKKADGTEAGHGEDIATSGLGLTSTVSYGSDHSFLSLIIPSLQNIMTIMAIGKINTTAGSVNVAIENAAIAGVPQTAADDYSGLKPDFVKGVLNKAYGVAAGSDDYFTVAIFPF